MMNIISETIPCQFDTCFSPYKADSWKEAFSDISLKGFTGVECAICYPNEMNIDELNETSYRNGLKITSLSTGQVFGKENASLLSQNEEKRSYIQNVILSHIELSAQIGRPNVTIGLIRGLRGNLSVSEAESRFAEGFLPCVEYAAKKNVCLQIEPICHEEADYILNTREAAEMIALLGNPQNVGILYDVYHSYIENEQYKEVIKKYSNHIFNVHFSDTNRGLPEKNIIPFQKITAELVEQGYQGSFTLEAKNIPNLQYVKDNCGISMFSALGKI